MSAAASPVAPDPGLCSIFGCRLCHTDSPPSGALAVGGVGGPWRGAYLGLSRWLMRHIREMLHEDFNEVRDKLTGVYTVDLR